MSHMCWYTIMMRTEAWCDQALSRREMIIQIQLRMRERVGPFQLIRLGCRRYIDHTGVFRLTSSSYYTYRRAGIRAASDYTG